VTFPLYEVSTFTAELDHGNPAAVVLMDCEREKTWYAAVAAFLAQPATAFLRRIEGGYALRWFSPTHELPLCGHGTLAAAHVLYETDAVAPTDAVTLSTQRGPLSARSEGGRCWIGLPATSLTEAPAPTEVLAALGLPDVQWFGRGDDDLVVVVDSVEQVLAVRPDSDLLLQLPRTRTIVTAAGGAGVDFTSRVFPPRIGVAEDQVTGTAHAALGPYWAARLGRARLSARQASARGGDLQLDLGTDGLVQIGGRAVTVVRGQLEA
jgi:PhzF family phenazine biosynthesis protein